MLCSRCGTRNPRDSANCFGCGRSLTTRSESSISPNNRRSDGSEDSDVARAYKEQEAKLKDQEFRQATLAAPMHLFFFTAIDRNGITRFFDIMQGTETFSVAETATTAARLAQCRETIYETPRTSTFHHVHRNYGSYARATLPSADFAMKQFSEACGLTQITKIAETLNQKEAIPTWDYIFQHLGCSTRSFSFKTVMNFTD